MRHHNSVFHELQKHVPWSVFERLVDEHNADRRVRQLNTKSQFLALLFGQLSGASSLREIEDGLISQSARLYHIGARCVARSTLADANARRPAALYGELFVHMAAAAGRRTRRRLGDGVRLLDATRLQLSSLSEGWLDAVKGHRAIKLHIAYDLCGNSPRDVRITDQRVNDITAAKTMPIEAGTSYVFDLAYYDFGWWADLHARGCRFVSRLKSHTKLQGTVERAVPRQANIISDRIGLLPQRMARSRRNPFSEPVREIVVRISSGKTIRLVTNDLEAPAHDIAELYKQRWQIELFFKWIKQNLKIRRFLGTSENAVRIQIFVALIAYLLLQAAQATQTAVTRPLAFARLVRLNLMHRRSINQLRKPPPTRTSNTNQLTLQLMPT